MSVFDGIFPQLASTLLKNAKLGAIAIVKKITPGYEPLTGEEVESSTKTWAVSCTPPTGFSMKLGWGTNVQSGDVQIDLCAIELGFRPDNTYTLVVGGIEYRIVSVNTISSGTKDVLYQIQGK